MRLPLYLLICAHAARVSPRSLSFAGASRLGYVPYLGRRRYLAAAVYSRESISSLSEVLSCVGLFDIYILPVHTHLWKSRFGLRRLERSLLTVRLLPPAPTRARRPRRRRGPRAARSPHGHPSARVSSPPSTAIPIADPRPRSAARPHTYTVSARFLMNHLLCQTPLSSPPPSLLLGVFNVQGMYKRAQPHTSRHRAPAALCSPQMAYCCRLALARAAACLKQVRPAASLRRCSAEKLSRCR